MLEILTTMAPARTFGVRKKRRNKKCQNKTSSGLTAKTRNSIFKVVDVKVVESNAIEERSNENKEDCQVIDSIEVMDSSDEDSSVVDGANNDMEVSLEDFCEEINPDQVYPIADDISEDNSANNLNTIMDTKIKPNRDQVYLIEDDDAMTDTTNINGPDNSLTTSMVSSLDTEIKLNRLNEDTQCNLADTGDVEIKMPNLDSAEEKSSISSVLKGEDRSRITYDHDYYNLFATESVSSDYEIIFDESDLVEIGDEEGDSVKAEINIDDPNKTNATISDTRVDLETNEVSTELIYETNINESSDLTTNELSSVDDCKSDCEIVCDESNPDCFNIRDNTDEPMQIVENLETGELEIYESDQLETIKAYNVDAPNCVTNALTSSDFVDLEESDKDPKFIYSCAYCTYEDENYVSFVSHQSLHTSNTVTKYATPYYASTESGGIKKLFNKCNLCDTAYKNDRSFLTHFSIAHLKRNEQLSHVKKDSISKNAFITQQVLPAIDRNPKKSFMTQQVNTAMDSNPKKSCMIQQVLPAKGSNPQKSYMIQQVLPAKDSNPQKSCMIQQVLPAKDSNPQKSCMIQQVLPAKDSNPQKSCMIQQVPPAKDSNPQMSCMIQQVLPATDSTPQKSCMIQQVLPAKDSTPQKSCMIQQVPTAKDSNPQMSLIILQILPVKDSNPKKSFMIQQVLPAKDSNPKKPFMMQQVPPAKKSNPKKLIMTQQVLPVQKSDLKKSSMRQQVLSVKKSDLKKSLVRQQVFSVKTSDLKKSSMARQVLAVKKSDLKKSSMTQQVLAVKKSDPKKSFMIQEGDSNVVFQSASVSDKSQKKNICPGCQFECDTQEQLVCHYGLSSKCKANKFSGFECRSCGFKTPISNVMMNHIEKSHAATKNRMYQCSCEFTTRHKGVLEIHLFRNHGLLSDQVKWITKKKIIDE